MPSNSYTRGSLEGESVYLEDAESGRSWLTSVRCKKARHGTYGRLCSIGDRRARNPPGGQEHRRGRNRANRRHPGRCASRGRSRSDWRRAASAKRILRSAPRRKRGAMRTAAPCAASSPRPSRVQLNAGKTKFRLPSIALRTRRQSALRLAGKNCRFFPSKREFRRFSPRNRRLAAKTVKQIKSLPANFRSDWNREYVPAEPGIKLAEPGNYREDCASLGIVRDGRAPRENQNETQPRHPSKREKYKSICQVNLIENLGLL
jgi:hypothetical protein